MWHACRRHDLHAGHRSYALRDETPVHFQYAMLPMWLDHRHPAHPPTPHCPHSCCHRICSGAQEQQLFMIVGTVASTSRDDGAHCGARPPCTFWYARPSPSLRDRKTIIPWGYGTFGGPQPSRGFEPPSVKSKSCACPTMLCCSPRSFALPLSIADNCAEARHSITGLTHPVCRGGVCHRV